MATASSRQKRRPRRLPAADPSAAATTAAAAEAAEAKVEWDEDDGSRTDEGDAEEDDPVERSTVQCGKASFRLPPSAAAASRLRKPCSAPSRTHDARNRSGAPVGSLLLTPLGKSPPSWAVSPPPAPLPAPSPALELLPSSPQPTPEPPPPSSPPHLPPLPPVGLRACQSLARCHVATALRQRPRAAAASAVDPPEAPATVATTAANPASAQKV